MVLSLVTCWYPGTWLSAWHRCRKALGKGQSLAVTTEGGHDRRADEGYEAPLRGNLEGGGEFARTFVKASALCSHAGRHSVHRSHWRPH